MAVWIFFLCSPDCPKQPRIEYPFDRFLYPMICGIISGLINIPWLYNKSHLIKEGFKYCTQATFKCHNDGAGLNLVIECKKNKQTLTRLERLLILS